MILFTSNRKLARAENIKAVYDAYEGEKRFVKMEYNRPIPDLHSGKYALQVTDELPGDTPGKCIFIGHGMGAGKTYGLDQPYPYFRRPDLLTYVIASSEEMVPVIARQCGISREQVIPLGMPRTDAYFYNRKYERPFKSHLYAPTFRPGHWWPDWNELRRHMPAGHKMLVKPHMVTGRLDGGWENIETVSPALPTTPYLLGADTVITDYSSIMFDAMVLRTPTILFAKDKERYLRERGMYMPYPDKYSKYFTDNEQELAACLEYAKWDDSDEALREFYAGACDGHSVERTIELIRSVL